MLLFKEIFAGENVYNIDILKFDTSIFTNMIIIKHCFQDRLVVGCVNAIKQINANQKPKTMYFCKRLRQTKTDKDQC